jgi:hypothetical protein
MADSTTPSTKTPWHLWVVGVVAALWNSMGVMDFVMTETRNAAYLAKVTPKQLEYFNSFPSWVIGAWGLAVLTGLLGSLLLLFRKRLAVPVLVASMIGMVLTDLYNFVLTNGLEVMGQGKATLIFPAIIFIIGLLLWLYARAMSKRGVLR